MVDVTPKEATHRRATARGKVFMQPETTSLVARGAISKGDVLAVARVAGIQAAKRTPDLIPLCHPLLVGSVLVNFRIEDTYVEVEAQVDTIDRTGVEMEALTACSVACLTIYDMCKSADRSMVVGGCGGVAGAASGPSGDATSSGGASTLTQESVCRPTCVPLPPIASSLVLQPERRRDQSGADPERVGGWVTLGCWCWRVRRSVTSMMPARPWSGPSAPPM